MFLHNFKYTFKVLLRKKVLIFWTIAFPILLGTLFNMAFSDIESSDKLDIIDIAIVDNEDFSNNIIYTETFKTLGEKDSEDQMFNIEYTSLENCKTMLENEEITGYIYVNGDDVNITVKQSGINETILRYVVDEMISGSEMFGLKEGVEPVINDISRENLSYTMIEFYTLIAMSCLYSGLLSMVTVNEKLANQKSVGKRTSVSPAGKGQILLGSLLASFIIQLFGVFLLFVYTIFVLKVDYGSDLLLVEGLAVVGSFAGLALGVAIGTLFKTNENAKIGILISVTMFGSFLSGMMGITMKYIVDKNVPILNKINPASMITDGLYSLYYYDTLDRYIFNIVSLLIFAMFMILISYGGLRRQKYDSI